MLFWEAFARAGLPYFKPPSFRNTPVGHGQELSKTPQDFGNNATSTTFKFQEKAKEKRRLVKRAR